MGKTIDCRFTVDASMLEFYQWAESLPPRIRGRELLFAARIGHLVNSGKLQTVSPAATLTSHRAEASEVSDDKPAQGAPVQPVHRSFTMEELNIDMAFLAGPPDAAKH